MGGSYRRLSLEQRIVIKERLDEGISMRAIARELGFSPSSIWAELKRVSEQTGRHDYDPYRAEELSRLAASEKGRGKYFEVDPALADRVATMILEDKMTVPSVAAFLASSQSVPVSYTTIYRAIDDGLIPGVTRASLRPEETKMFSGQLIHIPKWACEQFGFQDGDTFAINISANGQITLNKVSANE